MARLAAYYQEDFHYTPFGYGPKQRKTYAVYEEPKFNNHFHDGYRLRELGASDPALSPSAQYLSNTGTMTLKQKPYPYESQFGRNSQAAVIEHAYENIDFINSTIHPGVYENESVYPHDGHVLIENHYPSLVKSQYKDKINKRLSYSESWDNNLQSPKNYIPRTINKYESQRGLKGFDPYREEYFPANHGYVERTEQNYHSPVPYRDDLIHGKWQQWHWASPETYTNPALLSPPSPLDSGLSSQSITSSPSLEAEPLSMHSGSIPVSELDRRHACCCVENFRPDSRLVVPARMVANGRNSPGAYSTLSKHKKMVDDKFSKSAINDGYHNGHVRYGMMGIIGETSDGEQIMQPVVPKRSKHHSHKVNRSPSSCCDHPRQQNSRYKSQTSKSYKCVPDYTKPCVVITEASEKSTTSASSPDQEHSDKSPEPESSVSLAVSTSTSNSSSVASSSNELNRESELRKSKKAMEKEIRELEDMYKKCNLSDYELLERAERRDLPTPHQMKMAHTTSNLTRSKSDTFYEMLGPSYRNPYENHQRTPPVRRSGIPDLIADDMALRKHYKPTTTTSFNPVEKSITYMLCSSHFTPTVSAGRDILFENYPDVEYDDFSYRRHYFGKKSKIPDPQPPFGIPLRPPPPQLVFTDYLHAPVPAAELQPLCHPRGNPDVVRDDLAFRNLRKEEPERLYYDISQFYKKKRG